MGAEQLGPEQVVGWSLSGCGDACGAMVIVAATMLKLLCMGRTLKHLSNQWKVKSRNLDQAMWNTYYNRALHDMSKDRGSAD